MRTSINLSPELSDLINRYVSALSQRLGPRVSVSTAIEEAVGIGMPLMIERIPQKGETPHDFLMRRAESLRLRLQNEALTEEETLTLMREAIRFHDDCKSLLLAKGRSNTIDEVEAYHECIQAFLSAYNAGAERLNKGNVVKPKKAAR